VFIKKLIPTQPHLQSIVANSGNKANNSEPLSFSTLGFYSKKAEANLLSLIFFISSIVSLIIFYFRFLQQKSRSQFTVTHLFYILNRKSEGCKLNEILLNRIARNTGSFADKFTALDIVI
jgi:hypothetical protein